MTINNIAALFGAMLTLAIIPSPSVFAVIARSLSSGFIHGLITVIGILFGDFCYIVFAVYGLSAIASNLELLFTLVNYLGAAYLIWIGTKLCLAKSKVSEIRTVPESSWLASFLGGLFMTLGDSKAIFFYVSFFPAFLDLKQISITDTVTIMAIATITVGGVKVGYAYLAKKTQLLLKSPKAQKRINLIAGSVMIVTGIFLITKT